MNKAFDSTDHKKLMKAFIKDDIKGFTDLAKSDIDINSLNKWGETVISYIIKVHYTFSTTREFFNILLKNGASLKQIGLEEGLLSIVINNHQETYYLEELLKNNININDFGIWREVPEDENNFYNSAILTAIENCNNNFINLLLKYKPDLDIETHKGETILNHLITCYCEKGKHKELFPIFKKLLKYGADPDVIGCLGLRAIHHLALANCDISLFKILIKYNIDINAKNLHGDTALKITARHNKHELSRFLIKNGADMEITDLDGDSIIMLSVICRKFETFELLYNSGANLTRIGANNNNILHLLAESSKTCHLDTNDIKFNQYYKKISKLHPQLLDMKNTNGQTPFDIYEC